MIVTQEDILSFQETVWDYFRDHARSMPWRDITDPYYILVSELMLQQTQVDRVIPKFQAFIERFPTIYDLSRASLSDVLILWSGLGYNRRAKFLYEAAKIVEERFGGIIPDTLDKLVQLPGVGVNTAGAILTYGFNDSVTFIETNIRTVYFHHFFQDADAVTDAELRLVVDETRDKEQPREWYWALMDYGTFLKKEGAGRNSISSHYKKQAPLKGSVREVRGKIIKVLASRSMNIQELKDEVTYDERFDKALRDLIKEGFVTEKEDILHLTK